MKTLPQFNKKFHTVPDAATPATAAFLAKLYAPELAADTETFFQKAREALRYKRAEISLSASGAVALLQAKDFVLEWDCALDPAAPDEWVRTHALHSVASRALLDTPEFDGLFDGMFSKLEFVLATPVQIEAVIDAVEAAEGKGVKGNGVHRGNGVSQGSETPSPGGGFSVTYPSNYSQCTVRVEGVESAVVFTGGSIVMEFARPGSPRELADEFSRVRHAFDLSQVADVFPEGNG